MFEAEIIEPLNQIFVSREVKKGFVRLPRQAVV
jgi:hypothetical protein